MIAVTVAQLVEAQHKIKNTPSDLKNEIVYTQTNYKSVCHNASFSTDSFSRYLASKFFEKGPAFI